MNSDSLSASMKHARARGGVVRGAPNIEGRAAEEELFIFKLGRLFTPTAVLSLNQLKLLLNSDPKKYVNRPSFHLCC